MTLKFHKDGCLDFTLWEGKGSLDILLSSAHLTSIVQFIVALIAVLPLRGGSGLPLFCFLIQLGTQKFLIFLFDKTLRITEFRI